MHNTKFKVLVDKKQKTCLKKYLRKNTTYYNRILSLLKTFDSTLLQCTSCVKTEANVTALSNYDKLVRSLYKLSDNLKSCYPKRKAVPCTRSREACSKPFNYSLERALKRYAKKLRTDSLKKANGVPKTACKE